MNPKLIPALRQFCHNNGESGFVMAYDKDIVDREFAMLERLSAPTAQQSLTAGGAVPELSDERIQEILDALPISYWDVPQNATAMFARAILAAAAPLPQVQSEAPEAARYRHLRDYGDTEGQPCVWIGARWYGGSNSVGFALDDILDARIAHQQPVTEAKRETPSGALADNDGGVK